MAARPTDSAIDLSCLLIQFRSPCGHLIKCTFPDLGNEIIGGDELACPGAHRAFGKRDELEVDDLRHFLSHEFHRALELGPDQFVIGAEDINDPVEVCPFPGMKGEVPGSIDRGAVTPAEDVLVLEPEFGEIEIECLLFVCLGESV